MAAVAALAGWSSSAWAQSASKGPVIDVARQKLLISRLNAAGGETLSAGIDHNRQEWLRLSPDEREKYRREALAFVDKSPAEQDKLLKHYEQLIKMSETKRQAYVARAKWLEAVVASYTAAERADLEKLSPDARAAKLLERKAQLIRDGKLAADEPTTRPTTQPAK